VPELPPCLSTKPVSPECVPDPVQPNVTRTQLFACWVVKLTDTAVPVPVLVFDAPKPTTPEYSAAPTAMSPAEDIMTVIVLLVLLAAVAV